MAVTLLPVIKWTLRAGVGLALAAVLVAAGRLPDLPPPIPPPLGEAERVKEQARAPIDADRFGAGPAEVPVIRLLDHLKAADRKHPDLVASYRALGQGIGAPPHWQHYVDPWSRLPGDLRPLRVLMNFQTFDVRAYAAEARPGAAPAPRAQFGGDRSMNTTPGVNDTRLALYAPVPAAFTFRVAVPRGAYLRFGAAVPLNGAKGPVQLLVDVKAAGKPAVNVARVEIPQLQRHAWQDHRADLSAFAGQEVELTLRSEGARGAHAFFASPIIFRPGAGRPGKNIIFILVDTLRADGVRAVTGTHAVTPNLDALAAKGAVFTQAFSMASWTRTSLLGMWTGEFVSRFSWELNTAFWMPLPLRQKMYDRWPRLLTTHLKEQGYLVDAIANNFFLAGYTPIGFDRNYDTVTDIRAQIWDTPAITRGAVRYLREHQKRPFFLYLHYDGPHAPYWTPPGYPVKGARPPGGPNDVQFEQYLGESRWTDEHLGPIFKELERLGLEKDTVVVVTGDHGEIFHSAHDVIYGENNRTLHNHGFSLYQEAVHVPLILSAPGTVPAGRRVTAPVTHLDLVPTILDLAGVPALKGHQGHSLSPTILRNAPVPERPIINEGRWLFAIRRGKWRLLHRLGPMRAFRRPTGSRHYLVDELYDVEADPHETRNLAAEHPEVVKRLREELLGVFAPGEKSTGPEAAEDVFGATGLRLSLRLHGGTGPHKLEGTAACDGAVVVRSLQGPTSHAAYRGRGKVALLLEAPGGRPAGVEVEFVGCPPSSIALDLTLDGKPLRAHQVVAGPYGLRLVDQPTRLPLGHLPALVSRRPPPLGTPPLPQVHLWLGGSDTGAYELDGSGGSQAGKLADQMLRDAGYSKGPGGAPVPAPPAPPPAGGAP